MTHSPDTGLQIWEICMAALAAAALCWAIPTLIIERNKRQTKNEPK